MLENVQVVFVELILMLLLLPLLSLVFQSFGKRPSPSRFNYLESGAGGVQRHCGSTSQGNLVIK
jgi:ABC-type spermidine/putrescine transport system permease subunit II